MSTEYRLVVDRGHTRYRYPKRDLAHAIRGVSDADRDAGLVAHRPGTYHAAWIETREVEPWHRIDPEATT